MRESDDQRRKGNSDRARRADLSRWGVLIATVTARRPDDSWPARFNLAADLELVRLADLESTETLVSALALGRERLAAQSLHRMLSTLRSFTGWLAKRGHVARDVSSDDELVLDREHRLDVKAIDPVALEAISSVTQCEPPSGSRMWWPTRDAAVVALLARCGLRAQELCAARVAWIERQAERPILHVRGGKGAKDREVPLPQAVDRAVSAYLDERRTRAEVVPDLAVAPTAALFVRPDGRELNEQLLDRLLRGLAARANVSLPPGAAAHSFRHRFGSELALRGVPLSAIQQLLGHESSDTTAIYTRVAARDLIGVLDDAGLL